MILLEMSGSVNIVKYSSFLSDVFANFSRLFAMQIECSMGTHGLGNEALLPIKWVPVGPISWHG